MRSYNLCEEGHALRIAVEITMLVFLLAGSAGAVTLTSDGITYHTEDVSISNVMSITENSIGYVEGINDNQLVDPGYTTDPMKESTYLYQPSKTYNLKRIKWYTNSGYGNFTIRFREDINDTPGRILREVTFNLSGGNGFQGTDFTTSYPVTAGAKYWVGFYTEQQTGSHFASSGNIIEEYADLDLDGIWDVGPLSWLRPMVKFYEESAALTATFDPPNSTVTNNMGESRIFSITTDQTVNVTWLINGIQVQINNNVTVANYTNISAATGVWNVTAVASNSNGSDIHTWIWNVTQPIIGNGSISGMNFNDSNGNGRKDIGESSLSNWTIVLKNRNGSIVKTMMTDLNGNYIFGGLAAGNYAVEEVFQAGWAQTFPSTRIYNLTLATGKNMTGVDFGNNLISPQEYGVNAEREIEKESLSKGESTNITIRINSNVIQALALKEVIPAGWNLTRISDDANGFKNGTNEWVWSNVTPGITKTVIYAITAPTNVILGTYYINGTISNSSGVIAVVGGNNIITLDLLAYYRALGSDPDKVETTDLLKAMDDWRSRTAPAGFINTITNQELLALINEWTSS